MLVVDGLAPIWYQDCISHGDLDLDEDIHPTDYQVV